jgi:hypothetical protein
LGTKGKPATRAPKAGRIKAFSCDFGSAGSEFRGAGVKAGSAEEEFGRLKEAVSALDWKLVGLIGAASGFDRVGMKAVDEAVEFTQTRGSDDHSQQHAWLAVLEVALKSETAAAEYAVDALLLGGRGKLVLHISRFGGPRGASHATRILGTGRPAGPAKLDGAREAFNSPERK